MNNKTNQLIRGFQSEQKNRPINPRFSVGTMEQPNQPDAFSGNNGIDQPTHPQKRTLVY